MGENAIFIAPPSYGIDVVDQGMRVSSPLQTDSDTADYSQQGSVAGEEAISTEGLPVSHLQRSVRSQAVQRIIEEEEELLQGKFTSSETPAQRQVDSGEADNRPGMPQPLKTGLEALPGMNLSGVRVYYNASEPRQLTALTHTQGQDIHVGPGLEGQAVQRPLEENMREVKGNSTTPEIARFGHDLRRILIHTPVVGAIQTKLKVGAANDVYEREADKVAARIVSMSESSLKSGSEQGYPGAGIQRLPNSGGNDSDGYGDINLSHSGGSELSPLTRKFMEPRFGVDFGHVSLHRDRNAHETAAQINARAFTYGNHIWLGKGESEHNKNLMAHELTHLVQQNDGRVQGKFDFGRSEEMAATPEAVMAQKIVGAAPSQLSEEEEMIASPIRIARKPGSGGQNCSLGSAGPQWSRQVQVGGMAPTGGLRIQRVASFAAGAVHATNNTATQIATGGAAGITWHLLNSTRMATVANADAAVNKPVLGGRSEANSTSTSWVNAVATNTGSFDETVLSAGPWSHATTKGNVGTRLGLAACTGGDPCTLTANGIPSDADVAAANRTHEDHHAADHQDAFNAAFGPWDTAVTAAQASTTEFNGADIAASEAALWTAMGGTPEQIARAYRTDGFARGRRFHGTGAGGPLRTSNPASNANCSAASVEVRQ